MLLASVKRRPCTGDIHVHSVVPQGTAVTITLPAAANA
ncbi:HAMP domain-containing histidine kinase [Burkholderia pyrrocinia]|nr:HAMP domain-containing histidine kinase [Burkholderia pyrrocinia]